MTSVPNTSPWGSQLAPRPCGCQARGRHRQGCPAVFAQRREEQQRVTAQIVASKPKPAPTRYKVPKRPERASEEVPVGWMPVIPPRVSGLGTAAKKPRTAPT